MDQRYHVSITTEGGRSHASVLHDSSESAVAMAREVTGQDEGPENVQVGAQSVVYRGKGYVAIVTPVGAPAGGEGPAIPLPAAPGAGKPRRPRRPRRKPAS